MTLTNTRKAQFVSSGLGQHFTSPRKARDKKKTQTLVKFPAAELQHHHLLVQMQHLMNPTSSQIQPSPSTVPGGPSGEADDMNMPDNLDFMDSQAPKSKSQRRSHLISLQTQ